MSDTGNLSCRKKELVSKVGKLSKRECLQLLKIIQKHEIKYTENQNGCFVNLGQVEPVVFDDISQFVDMCLEVQHKNDVRDQQIREFEEEFDTCNKPVYQEYPHQENDFLSAIKKDKHLNSMEKSIMKENLKHSMAERPSNLHKKSLTPKYSGVRARLLRSCRTINRSSSGATISTLQPKPPAVTNSISSEGEMKPEITKDIETFEEPDLTVEVDPDTVSIDDDEEIDNEVDIDGEIENQ